MECSVTGTTTLDREWHRPIIRRFFIFSVSPLLMAICTNCGCLISCRNCLPFTSTWVLTLHVHMSSYPSRAPEFLPFTSTWVLTLHEHMSSYPSRAPEFTPIISGICTAHLFSFLCCVFNFVCLRPVSCVPNIASFSGLSILDFPFGFL
jgi:hypothetical protein